MRIPGHQTSSRRAPLWHALQLVAATIVCLPGVSRGSSGSIDATFVLGYAALGDNCPLAASLSSSAECTTATATSSTLAGCATCDASEIASLPTGTDSDAGYDVLAACSGTYHTLVLLRSGMVVGYGPLRLLGVGNDSESLVGCSASLDPVTVVAAGGAQAVHCVENISVVVLHNRSTLVFGQTSAASVLANDTTTVLSATTLSSLLGLSVDASLHAVAAGVGLDAVVVLLDNGSLVTTGTGSLRGVPSSTEPSTQWWRRVDAVCPAGAGLATNLSVGAQHALVVCGNGTLVGFGDNSFGQLSSNTSAFTIESPQTLVVSTLSSGIVHAAAGYSHSIALSSGVVGGQRQLLGAGDNSNGELGFDSGASALLAGFQALPTTATASLPGIISMVAAGRQYSALLVEHNSTATTRRYRSNLYVAGSNLQCAMGSSVAALGTNQKAWAVLRVHHSVPYYVTAIALSFSRRTLVSGYEAPTLSSSVSLPTASPSRHVSRSCSSSLLASVTLNTTQTMVSSSPSATSAFTQTTTKSKTVTLSASMEPGPTIAAVYWGASRRTLVVVFDAATNTPTTMVQTLFRISGAGQSFGESSLSDGVWVTAQELWVTFSTLSTANITASVAVLTIRTDVVALRRQGGFSLASTEGSTVAVVPSGSPESAQLNFGSKSIVTRAAIGAGLGILAAGVLLAVAARLLWSRCARTGSSTQRLSPARLQKRQPVAFDCDPLPSVDAQHPMRAARQSGHYLANEPTTDVRASPERHRQRFFLSPPTAPGPPQFHSEAEDGRVWTLSP